MEFGVGGDQVVILIEVAASLSEERIEVVDGAEAARGVRPAAAPECRGADRQS
jgi:hypothetical protein